jgi:hypothetical protein
MESSNLGQSVQRASEDQCAGGNIRDKMAQIRVQHGAVWAKLARISPPLWRALDTFERTITASYGDAQIRLDDSKKL